MTPTRPPTMMSPAIVSSAMMSSLFVRSTSCQRTRKLELSASAKIIKIRSERFLLAEPKEDYDRTEVTKS